MYLTKETKSSFWFLKLFNDLSFMLDFEINRSIISSQIVFFLVCFSQKCFIQCPLQFDSTTFHNRINIFVKPKLRINQELIAHTYTHNWLSVNGRPQDDFTRWNQLLNPTVILMYMNMLYSVHDSFVHYAVNISKSNSNNNIRNE